MKYSILHLALACVPYGVIHAQEANNKIPGPRQLLNIPYVLNGSDRQKLDLYLPPPGGKPRPLVVWIHGGGWEGGSKDACPAKPLLGLGYAVASLDYRLTQQATFPAQIEDCKAAIRWLRAHSREYGIDPGRIGVWGASAGGHLVALLGTTANLRDFDAGENLDQPSNVQCVIDWFGPADFLHWGDVPDLRLDRPDSAVARLLGGTVAAHQELARRASPVDFVKAGSAPFLIMHGDKDPLVPVQQSKELHEALQQAGVESILKIIPGAGHGGPVFGTPDNQKLIVDFLGQHLQGASVLK